MKIAGLYSENNRLLYTWNYLLKNKIICEMDGAVYSSKMICKKGHTLVLPNTISRIENYSFMNMAIKKIYLCKNISLIRDFAFSDCDLLSEIEVDLKNKYFSSKNGVLFNKEQTELVYYPQAKNDELYKIDTKNIANYAFSKNKYIKKIIVSNNVENIEYKAFEQCNNLEEVILGSNIKNISSAIFWKSKKLKKIEYLGKQNEFKKIIQNKMILDETDLCVEKIYYKKTMKDLLNNGYDILEANKQLKEYEKYL